MDQRQSPNAANDPPAGVQAVLWPLQPEARDEIGLGEIRSWLSQGRLLIAVTAAVCAVLAIAVAFIQTPVYRAETVLAVAETSRHRMDLGEIANGIGGLGGLAGIIGAAAGGGTEKNEFIALLRSRSFTESFIQKEGLMPVLFADDWDATAKRWKVSDPADAPTLFKAYRVFDRKIRKISDSRTTGLVTVTIDWRDRELASRWANRLVAQLNERARERAIVDARKSLEYLNRELAKTDSVELRQSIFRIVEAQMSTIMLATVRQEYAFRVLDPARAPDADSFIKPKRLLLIALGIFGGLAFGAALAITRGLARRTSRD